MKAAMRVLHTGQEIAGARRRDRRGRCPRGAAITEPGRRGVPRDHANSFVDGLAWAANKGRGGLIDHTGKYVIKPAYGPGYDHVERVDGIVDVCDGPNSDMMMFIDRSGREYISPDTRAWYAKQPKKPEE